jgi:ribosomal protein L13
MLLDSAINKNTDNTTVGKVQSFVIGPQGRLSDPVDEALSGGSSPSYAARLSTGEVVVVNVCLV